MRARKKSWAQKELTTSKFFIDETQEIMGKWKNYFGNDNPIHIEIGCGKGNFITTLSKQNPNINYIGIEKEEQVIIMALKNARESECNQNIAFMLTDVKLIEDYFQKDEISRVYINFCDPWHRKKKWFKRRLTHNNFLTLYKSIMTTPEIHFKTDNKMLFEFSLNELSEFDWKMKNITLDLHNSDFQGNIMTEYERKFSEMGMPIYRLEAIFLA